MKPRLDSKKRRHGSKNELTDRERQRAEAREADARRDLDKCAAHC